MTINLTNNLENLITKKGVVYREKVIDIMEGVIVKVNTQTRLYYILSETLENIEMGYVTMGKGQCSIEKHFEGTVCVQNYRPCTENNVNGIQYRVNGKRDVCIASCSNTNHMEESVCVSNVKPCTLMPNGVFGMKLSGTQTWINGNWGSCVALTCSEVTHLEGGVCVSNTKNCTANINRGGYLVSILGIQTWYNGYWGSCIQTCPAGQHKEGTYCVNDTKDCYFYPYGYGYNSYSVKGKQYWTNGTWSSCQTTLSCNSNQHMVSNYCEENVRNCMGRPYGYGHGSYGIIGTQAWLNGSWGECQLITCQSDQHLEVGLCQNNTKSCIGENGGGIQTWMTDRRGLCVVDSCNSGYVLSGTACINL